MEIRRMDEEWDWSKARYDLTPEEEAEVYRLARQAFTAADLQEFTELDEGVPVEEVLEELEQQQRECNERRHERTA